MRRFVIVLAILLTIRLISFYAFKPHETYIIKSPVRETGFFSFVKQHIRQDYDKNLGAQNGDLLMGIVFGEKDLDPQTNKLFQATGVLHVVAASGMNVTMLIGVVIATLSLFLKRQHALFLTSIIIVFYAALADFQPSIVRAAIMGLSALGAGIVGRQNTSILSLVLAGAAMIFWDPLVITSVGFILSFAATLGIILFDPLFKQGVFGKSIFEDFRTTISAQIATTPILLFFFGIYSPFSIPVNLLVLWTVPPLMILGGVGSILTFISPYFSAPFILLALPLLSYFMVVVTFFARFAAPIEVKTIPWTMVAGYYMIILSIFLALVKKRRKD